MEIHEKYKIIKTLGTQKVRKFGDVFLVQNKQSGEHAVLKTVNRARVSELVCDQLKNESKFNFEHTSLPQIVDFLETEDELMLFTSFKSGIPINEFWNQLKKKQRIPFLITFLDQFDQLYVELRIREIVHCDLKPSNILIDGTIDSFEIRLLDFGLALKKQDFHSRKLIFPLGFAAPELLLNELEIIDERTDIFAMGILIWRLYTKELPLTHPNPSIFTNLQLTHPLPEHSDVPNKLFTILAKMCSKHQFRLPPNKMISSERRELLIEGMNARYTHFNEIVEDLKAIQNKRKVWWPFTT